MTQHPTHPHFRRPHCSLCDDHGMVLMDKHVPDEKAPGGFRPVAMAYRCECAAGARYQAHPLAPRPEQRTMGWRRDVDG